MQDLEYQNLLKAFKDQNFTAISNYLKDPVFASKITADIREKLNVDLKAMFLNQFLTVLSMQNKDYSDIVGFLNAPEFTFIDLAQPNGLMREPAVLLAYTHKNIRSVAEFLKYKSCTLPIKTHPAECFALVAAAGNISHIKLLLEKKELVTKERLEIAKQEANRYNHPEVLTLLSNYERDNGTITLTSKDKTILKEKGKEKENSTPSEPSKTSSASGETSLTSKKTPPPPPKILSQQEIITLLVKNDSSALTTFLSHRSRFGIVEMINAMPRTDVVATITTLNQDNDVFTNATMVGDERFLSELSNFGYVLASNAVLRAAFFNRTIFQHASDSVDAFLSLLNAYDYQFLFTRCYEQFSANPELWLAVKKISSLRDELSYAPLLEQVRRHNLHRGAVPQGRTFLSFVLAAVCLDPANLSALLKQGLVHTSLSGSTAATIEMRDIIAALITESVFTPPCIEQQLGAILSNPAVSLALNNDIWDSILATQYTKLLQVLVALSGEEILNRLPLFVIPQLFFHPSIYALSSSVPIQKTLRDRIKSSPSFWEKIKPALSSILEHQFSRFQLLVLFSNTPGLLQALSTDDLLLLLNKFKQILSESFQAAAETNPGLLVEEFILSNHEATLFTKVFHNSMKVFEEFQYATFLIEEIKKPLQEHRDTTFGKTQHTFKKIIHSLTPEKQAKIDKMGEVLDAIDGAIFDYTRTKNLIFPHAKSHINNSSENISISFPDGFIEALKKARGDLIKSIQELISAEETVTALDEHRHGFRKVGAESTTKTGSRKALDATQEILDKYKKTLPDLFPVSGVSAGFD